MHTHTHTTWWHNWTESLFLFFLHAADRFSISLSLSLSLSLSVSLWPWFWVQSVLHPRSTIGWIGLTHTPSFILGLLSCYLIVQPTFAIGLAPGFYLRVQPTFAIGLAPGLLSYSSTHICNWVTRTTQQVVG